MKIKIHCPTVTGVGYTREYLKKLHDLHGQVVSVETEHLFRDQFNIAKLRVFNKYVSRIYHDERVGKMKCNDCGHQSSLGFWCPKCDSGNVDWFPQNALAKYFVIRNRKTGYYCGGICGDSPSKRKASHFSLSELKLLFVDSKLLEVIPSKKDYTYDM